jgi:hypothetical protein
MNKKNLLKLSLLLSASLWAENVEVIKNDISQISGATQVVNNQETNRVAENQKDEEFSNSLANKINSKLDVLNKQIEEAQQIKESSLGIPKSQILEEKRAEQYLPIMSGSYTIKMGNKVLENKALSIDEKEQKYYLNTKNNDLVQRVSEDYLVYKNSESNKTFKSPMALPNKTKDAVKVSSTDTINSVTPIIQDLNKTPLPPISAVEKEIASITK